MLALRKASRCTKCAFASCIRNKTPEGYQQKFWHVTILQEIFGSSRSGKVPTWSKFPQLASEPQLANILQLNNLVQSGIVEAYPPLVDKKGSYTAQFEHVSFVVSSLLHLLMFHNRPSCSDQT